MLTGAGDAALHPLGVNEIVTGLLPGSTLADRTHGLVPSLGL